MLQFPKISDSEWEVMKVLWLASPRTANEVIEVLQDRKDWSPKTVRTLLNRLVEKSAVAYNQVQRVYSYYPLLKETECIQSETQSFLSKIYGGALKPMLVNFLKDDKLSKEDLEELKGILEQRRD
ncbi:MULTISPECIES: BlaI/MecI/CopY family transcriptional regulator [Paenibacillus]|uniref:BlaI/MecI/CopY family transcriptional regulator n=1 Tax=Paenibacillus artemisiicola TaxID=1172618 RepID=A0ABS3WBU4_9BACL|nr:BlaI/MecI/CopY family transcriptional regulator [Paenibacillus artemisiicola]MBO7745792.1 BlaI/MecI/CopY family transcriptional regulator [Paenibacillus artemisiicola]